jgi:hypothetical protein
VSAHDELLALIDRLLAADARGAGGRELNELRAWRAKQPPASPAPRVGARCDAAFDGVQCELDAGHTKDHQHSDGPTVGSVVKWSLSEMARKAAENAGWVGAPRVGAESEEAKR